jgi:RHS repeat-associated protein
MYNDLAYAPFGETYALSGSTGVTDISFAGNNEDTTTNLYDAYFREYEIYGRWPSPDPAGMAAANPANPQSWNRYAYALNNPLLFIDSLGLQQTCQTDGQDVPCPTGNGRPPMPPILQCFYDYPNGDIDFEGCIEGYPGSGGGYYAPLIGPGGGGGVGSLRGELLDKLLSDPNCLSFLGRNDANSLSDIAAVPISVANLNSPTTQAVTSINLSPTGPVPSNASIVLNQSSAFFTTGSQVSLSGTSTIFTSGTPQFQAAVLLHEFGHVTGALLQNDASSAQAEGLNNQAILTNCSQTINSFSGGTQ